MQFPPSFNPHQLRRAGDTIFSVSTKRMEERVSIPTSSEEPVIQANQRECFGSQSLVSIPTSSEEPVILFHNFLYLFKPFVSIPTSSEEPVILETLAYCSWTSRVSIPTSSEEPVIQISPGTVPQDDHCFNPHQLRRAGDTSG